jgi:hypothetical protein
MTENTSFVKILSSVILMVILILPIASTLISKSSRLWLKTGIEGQNKRLDLSEIWEMIYMVIALGSFYVLVYMIINKTLGGVIYSWEEYTLVFLSTAGSNGVTAWVMYLKDKKNAQPK